MGRLAGRVSRMLSALLARDLARTHGRSSFALDRPNCKSGHPSSPAKGLQCASSSAPSLTPSSLRPLAGKPFSTLAMAS